MQVAVGAPGERAKTEEARAFFLHPLGAELVDRFTGDSLQGADQGQLVLEKIVEKALQPPGALLPLAQPLENDPFRALPLERLILVAEDPSVVQPELVGNLKRKPASQRPFCGLNGSRTMRSAQPVFSAFSFFSAWPLAPCIKDRRRGGLPFPPEGRTRVTALPSPAGSAEMPLGKDDPTMGSFRPGLGRPPPTNEYEQ